MVFRRLLSLATIVLVAAAIALYSCHRSAHPHPDHPQLANGVVLHDVSFFSSALGREMPYRVFLPTLVQPGQKLPVVYLLHGNGGDFRDWSNYSDVSAYAAKGLILVMPEGNSYYFMNAVEKPRDRFENYLVHDLIADVESRFPVKANRENRTIVGVSMGGFAAAELALSHPDLFVFAAAISPAIDVPERHFSWRRMGQSLEFRSIFGPAGTPAREARDPFMLAGSADAKRLPYLYLTAGQQEPLLEPIRRFAGLLEQRHLAYQFHTLPGGHDWGEWDGQIPGCFAALLQHLGNPVPSN